MKEFIWKMKNRHFATGDHKCKILSYEKNFLEMMSPCFIHRITMFDVTNIFNNIAKYKIQILLFQVLFILLTYTTLLLLSNKRMYLSHYSSIEKVSSLMRANHTLYWINIFHFHSFILRNLFLSSFFHSFIHILFFQSVVTCFVFVLYFIIQAFKFVWNRVLFFVYNM